MREILFRGKQLYNGEWVYGDIIHRRYYKNTDVVVIRTEDSGFDNYSDYEVDPSTIGQFTGLTDKNGKKIFEGDIVKVSHGGSTYCAKIEWDSGSFWVTNHDIQMPNYISEVSRTYLEIIGNIYDDNLEELANGR